MPRAVFGPVDFLAFSRLALKHGLLIKCLLFSSDGTPINAELHDLWESLREKYFSVSPVSSQSTDFPNSLLMANRTAPSSFSPLTVILHGGIPYVVVYIESGVFTRRLYQLAGPAALDVLSALQAELIKNPSRGDLVPGLGGIRKARCANPARRKGKSGGYRYLFLYLENRDHIHLLYLLDKDEQEDLSNEERKELRALVAEIKGMR